MADTNLLKLQKLKFFIDKSLFLLGEGSSKPSIPQNDDKKDIEVFVKFNTSILEKFAKLFNLVTSSVPVTDEFLKTEISKDIGKKKELLFTIINLMKSQYDVAISNKDSEINAEKKLRADLQTEHAAATAKLEAANEDQKKEVAKSILSRKLAKLTELDESEKVKAVAAIEGAKVSLEGDKVFNQTDFIDKLDAIREAFTEIYSKKADEEKQSSCDDTLESLKSFFGGIGENVLAGGGGSSRSSIKRTMKKRKRTNRKLKKRSRKNRSRQNRSSKRRTRGRR